MTMVAAFQGSVNRWECDENDHLNVRFYLQKAEQGLLFGLPELGIADAASAPGLLSQVDVHHIRYLQEARMAAPLRGELGIVGLADDRLQLLTILRHGGTEQPLATVLTDIRLRETQIARVATDLRFLDTVPDFAQPRGVLAEPSPYAQLDRAAAEAHGYSRVGAGVIHAHECSGGGRLLDWQLLGRISDGMPNFWARIEADKSNAEFLGGAVLEFRLQRLAALSVGQRYEQLTAIGDVGNKTHELSHLIYDRSTGIACAAADAVAIAMDLEARKSISISPERRARLLQQQRRPLAP